MNIFSIFHFRKDFNILKKCSAPIPICDSGPDHICSNGKCYSQSGCPLGTTQMSTGTCTCSNACNGTSTSYLQVNITIKSALIILLIILKYF